MAPRKGPLTDDNADLLEQPDPDELPPEEEDEEGDDANESEFADDDESATEDETDEGGDEEEGADEGETVVAFADDDEGGKDDESVVIRRIRDRNKELARENLELRKATAAAPQAEELGPKPKMEDCDFDEERFEEALDAWKTRKAKIEESKAEQNAQTEAIQREWQRDLEGYQAKKTALGMADFDEAIEPIKATLTLAQQAVIVKAANDPAAFTYALAGSDARLTELAKIQDPIKLAAAIARMEGGVQVTKRRKAPPPDKAARGSAKMPGSSDKELAKLEATAAETGDRTPVIRYRKRLEARGKKAA